MAGVSAKKSVENSELESFRTNSKVDEILLSLAKMAKNPSIESDLSQTLDQYLNQLKDCEAYLENGICSMNFTKAALLLQSSADIYSKKVDLLWDIIFDFQKRMVLTDDKDGNKNQELENLEERRRKYKRKRQTNENQSQGKKLVNQLSFGSVNTSDYLNQAIEQNKLIEEWKKFNSENESTARSNKGDLRIHFQLLPNSSLHTEDKDYLGRYDQFHAASLIEAIFDVEDRQRIDSFIEKSEAGSKLADFVDKIRRAKENNKYIVGELEQTCKSSSVILERLPQDLVNEKLRSCSSVDSMFDDAPLSSTSGHDSEDCDTNFQDSADRDIQEDVSCDPVTEGLEKHNISCSQDSAFYDEDEFTNGTSPLRSPLVKSVETPITNDELCCGSSVVITRLSRNKRKLCNDDFVCNQNEETKVEVEKRRKPNAKKRVSEKVLRKLATGITANFREFERFCRANYSPEEKEGAVPPMLSDSEDSDEDSDTSDEDDALEEAIRTIEAGIQYGDDNEEDLAFEEAILSIEAAFQPPAVHIEDELNLTIEEALNTIDAAIQRQNANKKIDLTFEEAINTTEAAIQRKDNNEEDAENPEISEPTDTVEVSSVGLESSSPTTSETRERTLPTDLSPEDLGAVEQSRNNVKEWRSFITPIIRKMDHKADFDIHAYGSNIIEPMKIGEERSFKSIVTGQKPSEVARFFVAALQLANTNNVEITGGVPGQIANDTFQVKALDKTRHHQLLEDYQAPSEETFRARLEKAKAANPAQSLHSTPVQSPAKVPELSRTSKKKLF